MRCRDCSFRSQIDDIGLIDAEGNTLPVFRCRLMREFKPLSNLFCAYLLDATQLFEDTAYNGSNVYQIEAVRNVKERIEDLNSTLVSLTLDEGERVFLLGHLTQIEPLKTRLSQRLTEWTEGRPFKTTLAECCFLVDFIQLKIQKRLEEFEILKNLQSKLIDIVVNCY